MKWLIPRMDSTESDCWASCYKTSIWEDTGENWDLAHDDWRVIGSNPFKKVRTECVPYAFTDECLYIIEFLSKRLDIAFRIGDQIPLGLYVILEADRGEDCGLVKAYTSRIPYESLLRKYKITDSEFKIKRVYRIATDCDLEILHKIKPITDDALKQCRVHVLSKSLDMEVINCEYQFDMNKITFFFKSSERIDFRELVKELYKIFKTRIWMCSMEKSKDGLLRELIACNA
ncbi:hypothetical protein ENBRE01_0943 [Enteropsectra breve]|nr:hypothetical protein ENBRE01_0943 [Enteropsectra breve]